LTRHRVRAYDGTMMKTYTGSFVAAALLACLALGATLVVGCYPQEMGKEPPRPTSPAAVVPDLTGMMPEEAAKVLTERGLVFGQITTSADSTWAAVSKPGLIVRQSETPGARVPRRTVVNTIVYRPLASEYSIVPELLALKYDEAAAALKRAGLLVGEVSRRYVGDPRLYDVVYRQSPEPDTLVQRWSKVNLGLYGPVGDPVVRVPKLTGLSAAEVPAVLVKAGLQQGTVTTVKAPSKSLVGIVRGQTPAIGTEVKKDTKVSIVVYAD
jgi:beta-lactam-binding protein with PASTA domain